MAGFPPSPSLYPFLPSLAFANPLAMQSPCRSSRRERRALNLRTSNSSRVCGHTTHILPIRPRTAPASRLPSCSRSLGRKCCARDSPSIRGDGCVIGGDSAELAPSCRSCCKPALPVAAWGKSTNAVCFLGFALPACPHPPFVAVAPPSLPSLLPPHPAAPLYSRRR